MVFRIRIHSLYGFSKEIGARINETQPYQATTLSLQERWQDFLSRFHTFILLKTLRETKETEIKHEVQLGKPKHASLSILETNKKWRTQWTRPEPVVLGGPGHCLRSAARRWAALTADSCRRPRWRSGPVAALAARPTPGRRGSGVATPHREKAL